MTTPNREDAARRHGRADVKRLLLDVAHYDPERAQQDLTRRTIGASEYTGEEALAYAEGAREAIAVAAVAMERAHQDVHLVDVGDEEESFITLPPVSRLRTVAAEDLQASGLAVSDTRILMYEYTWMQVSSAALRRLQTYGITPSA